jgi:hypothetical protein
MGSFGHEDVETAAQSADGKLLIIILEHHLHFSQNTTTATLTIRSTILLGTTSPRTQTKIREIDIQEVYLHQTGIPST